MADYLESYAGRFRLPVRTGVQVDELRREGTRFALRAGQRRFEAENVVVAMSNWQQPRVPAFVDKLSAEVAQLHSSEYRSPSQLKDGDVLIVGAGNSGAEIAMEVSRKHRILLSGDATGEVPFRIESAIARHVLLPVVARVLFHRILTRATPMGRRVRAKRRSHGMPLLRVKAADLARAGVERVPRTVGVQDGRPVLADGRVLDVANVIWCTGFDAGFSWIHLPVFEDGEPMHDRGTVDAEPGLYFVGLSFLYSASSSMIHGVGRDAERVAKAITLGVRASTPATRSELEAVVTSS
jgi:putative flavoprotein involved in K+ transport